ncbi:MAG: UDP-glucose 4-epimerase GalE [Candidatus Omnitrophica bacterium]|nr:UDP-glucose 4-epimerase GalE [Candidatus Omnitrophota bacterium]
MKIIITGGAGYIGSHTVVELATAGYKPVIIDNFCNSRKDVIERLKDILGFDVPCHEGNCCDENFMRSVFDKESEITGVVHFAALKAVGESVKRPQLYHTNNVGAMKVILKVVTDYQIPYLVFSSSACVYGQPDKLPATEETPLQKATSPYGETKKICEDLIKELVCLGDQLRAVSLRYFNPVGAHESAKIGEFPIGTPNNLVPFVTQAAAGKLEKLVVYGNDYNTPDGSPIRDYIHVVDLAKAHIKALEYLSKKQDIPKGKGFYDVFNLGTGKGNSVMEVIKTFEQVTGIKLNYVIGPRREGDVEALYASCDKAKRILDWHSERTLAQSLKDSWAWQKTLE